jgi:hypothetical protein
MGFMWNLNSSVSKQIQRLFVVALLLYVQSASALSSASSQSKKVAVFGGTGYVGSQVCARLVQKGFDVTAVSRRGTNPKPNDALLSQVRWVQGDATDYNTVSKIVQDADAVVHSIGLLFDVDSGLQGLNKIVSGSGSLPGDQSTYDNITRLTMFNVIQAIGAKKSNPFAKKERMPLCFVSCAEAGWPDVTMGDFVEEKLAPEWLQKYLKAKRAVESKLGESKTQIRACIYRPSLIWDWTKFDVLPVIPVFNLASAVGVPFVDKTVRVETLANAIVQGIMDDNVEGVQRYMQMEELAARN